ncbi:MAG: SGNH/GDSL hydrolase family protein [Lachnospiraceae bacterium]|nr:SGNH/GDSL hydrolase family protein [Lachnospiraceae bacterium]
MKKKLIAIIAITVIIVAAALLFFQALLVPKYMGEAFKEGALIAEYYDNAGDNDVLFVGDCEVYENVSPITLWEEYGITSYIRGSAQQLTWQSYYLLEDMLKYEKPKVIIFNVLAMKYGSWKEAGTKAEREAYNRMSIDGMRWSKAKWDCIQVSMTDEERENGGAWSYIFPLLRFHSRWDEVSAEDWQYLFHRDQVSDNGYLMKTGVVPVEGEYHDMPLADYTFSDLVIEYLDKMRVLCEENDIQFVLMKAPTLYPIWHDEYEEQVEAYAEKYGLVYINLLEHIEDMGIDWQTDTYDAGLHLNVYGAEKLSHYLGQVLMDECPGLEDRRTDESVSGKWALKVEKYMNRKNALEKGE